MPKFNGWVARDEDKYLFFYDKEPIRVGGCWEVDCCLCENIVYLLPDNLFPEVQWTDKEPLKVEVEIRRVEPLEVKG